MSVPANRKGILRLVVFALYTVAIFVSLPFGRSIALMIRRWGWLSLSGYIITAALVAFFVLLIFPYFVSQPLKNRLCLFIPVIITGAMFLALELPEERLHFVEYGVLGYMAGWALAGLGKWPGRFKEALGVLFCIGLLDELVQGILPSRFFGLHDVFWNMVSSWCGLWVFLISTRHKEVQAMEAHGRGKTCKKSTI